MSEHSNEARLRFASSILARLGEELIPDPDQGLLELARNAYDAGATECVIELVAADSVGGQVRVSDDGNGMTHDDIVNGFLVLGRSRKTRRAHGRLLVGEKGLGRLAALRLGRRVTLITRPEGAGLAHELTIDWDRFADASVVEDVVLDIHTTESDEPSGTLVIIDGLFRAVTASQQASLARSLLLLSDPFGAETGFEAKLTSAAFGDLATLVRQEYLAAADFRLQAQLDEDGHAVAELFGQGGRSLAKADHADLRGDDTVYDAPKAEYELYVFRLGGRARDENVNMQLRHLGVRKIQSWLRAVGGIHFYHRGLRVRPFGDPGYDWLQLDVARVRSPEDRPSTNTVVGRVLVDDEDDALLPKTDRLGFVENQSFNELRDFAMDANDFMARWRTEDSRARRQIKQEKARSQVDRANDELAKAVRALPPQQRAPIEAAVETYAAAAKRVEEGQLADIQLYRTLSTVGAATAVFAHESDKPTEQLLSLLKLMRRRSRRLASDQGRQFEEPLDELDRVARGLRALTRMPLRLLRADRRRVSSTSVSSCVEEALETFGYFLDRAGVEVKRFYADEDLVEAAPAAIEVIVANMLVNAVAAFYVDKRVDAERVLSISTMTDEKSVSLEISDTGPGFQRIRAEDVWKLGETRREGGSGLGLTIVRDTVTDLRGTVDAVSPGTLGGASFFVRLPRAKT